jgi:hypothetical protein
MGKSAVEFLSQIETYTETERVWGEEPWFPALRYSPTFKDSKLERYLAGSASDRLNC